MSNAMREQVNGTSSQDIMKINENFESLWFKLHGDVDFADTTKNMQSKIQTQWIPVQGEGNLDLYYPLYIRFFIPPNTKRIDASNFNAMVENYRMDSSVATGGGGMSNVEIAMSMGSSTISCSLSSDTTTSFVNMWGNYQADGNTGGDFVSVIPSSTFAKKGDCKVNGSTQGGTKVEGFYPFMYGYNEGGGRDGSLLCPVFARKDMYDANKPFNVIDMAMLQHRHSTSHSHNFSQSPHTHSANGRVSIPNHSHNLNEGIKVSTIQPSNVTFFVNGYQYAMLNGSGSTSNNIDIKDRLLIGQWNTIKVTTINLARVVLYGTLELEIKN